MTTDSGSISDDDLLATWFDEFVDDVLDGRVSDLESRIERRPELRERVTESFLRAHRLVGRRLPTTPRIPGYEIEREIGRGGMGAVFLARHVELGRRVALKVLPTTFGLSERARDRFLLEVRALANVTDDHVVRVHNVIANDEALAFEMEYVDGPTLRAVVDHLRRRGRDASVGDVGRILDPSGRRPPDRTLLQWSVRIAATIARALARVHEAGLVHRDVKPSNILLRRDGTPLLADFGLVRDTAASATRTEAFVGTLSYAAPEQLRGDVRGVDARTDVYALGATLWELVVLRPPQDGTSAIDVLRQVEARGAPRLRRHATHAPRDLETILEKALEPDPHRRYQSVEQLARDLEHVLRWEPITARSPGVLERAARRVRRHRVALLAAAAGAALVAGVFVPQYVVERRRIAREADAAREVGVAHEHLVSPSVRDRAWRQITLGVRHESERLRDVASAAPVGLTAALAAYDRALARTPDDATIRLERTLVQVAASRGATSSAREGAGPARADVERLPPVTRDYAVFVLSGEVGSSTDNLDRVRAATPDDRRALGLLAFLVGDVRLCEAAWSGLDPMTTDAPLADAGLGLLYAIDGWPERAYPRILGATRAFPHSQVLAATLADVALELGDADVALRWLERADRDDAGSVDARLARSELLRVRGDVGGARAVLADMDPTDVRVALRLARLAAGDGDLAGAAARLEDAVAAQPNAVAVRAALADVALRRGDRGTYLAQAQWVVANDWCAARSPGAGRDAIRILRAGGLDDLAARGVARGATSRAGGAWAEASAPRRTDAEASPQEVVILRRVAAARDAARRLPLPGVAGPRRTAATALAAGTSAWLWFPEGHAAVPFARRLWLTAGAAALRSQWRAVLALLDRLLGDDDAAPLALHEVQRWTGDAELDQLGAIAAVGDIDGDDVPDVATGTIRDPNDGAGTTTARSGADGRVLWAHSEPGCGLVVAGIGDVDGDRRADIATTAIEFDARGGARSVVRLWSPATGRELRTLSGRPADTSFGTSVTAVPDFDGDGAPEIAIGAMGTVGGVGYVTVFSGATGELLASADGPPAGSFGCSIAPLDDIDGDGAAEIAVGAMFADGGRGQVFVVSARTGAIVFTIGGSDPRGMFGTSVASGADVDGDGLSDVAVGAPLHDHARGLVEVRSGRDGTRIAHAVGLHANDGLGWAVALCDLDGDGLADLAGGCGDAPHNGPRAGRVLVFDGRSLRGLEPRMLAELRGRAAGDRFGSLVVALPGRRALLVSAPGADARRGAVSLLDLHERR